MRPALPERLERARVTTGKWASDSSFHGYGWFMLQGPCGAELKIIASMGDHPLAEGWEHVSVSIDRRIPNWLEMCFVKDLFWSDDEMVVQYHPPKSEYVNNHPHCLHLWHNTNVPFPTPSALLVGVKDFANMSPEEAAAVESWKA